MCCRALCGACADGYDYDVGRNRCAACPKTAWEMLGRVGNLSLLMVMAVAGLTYAAYHWDLHSTVAAEVASVHARRLFDLGDLPPDKEKHRRKILTKLKIVVATMQIASSVDYVLFRIHFPTMFAVASRLGRVLTVVDVGTCLFRWTYLEKLLVVTLGPFLVVPVAAGVYWVLARKFFGVVDKRKPRSQIIYGSLLFVYVILPSIATSVFTYFSCAAFDRGHGRRDLRVIATQLDIKCTTPRYRRWAVYTGFMIFVWPVGVVAMLAVILWTHRTKLNPRLEATTHDLAADLLGGADAAPKCEALDVVKVHIRDADDSVATLSFLFEDFRPSCYLFPLFDIVRRLGLSSVLAVFYPGTSQQVYVGLLGTMLSYVVFASSSAYIDHDDNVLASVASAELVLVFFSGLAVYVADVADDGSSQAAFAGTAFAIFLILVYFMTFLIASSIILLDLFGHATLLGAIQAAGTSLRRGRHIYMLSPPRDHDDATTTTSDARLTIDVPAPSPPPPAGRAELELV